MGDRVELAQRVGLLLELEDEAPGESQRVVVSTDRLVAVGGHSVDL